MSGDRLPHFGSFPSLNFAPWNHHAAHSIPKMVSKWDCRSSTQSFARGSKLSSFFTQSSNFMIHTDIVEKFKMLLCDVSRYPSIGGMPLLLLVALFLSGCGDSVRPTPIHPTALQEQKAKVYERNATDTVAVTKSRKKLSPFGKSAH